MRLIKRTNPKGSDIRVSDDAAHFSNDHFALSFQVGEIPMHGVRNGAFDAEILAVLIERANAVGGPLLAKLEEAMAIMVPVPFSEPTKEAPKK